MNERNRTHFNLGFCVFVCGRGHNRLTLSVINLVAFLIKFGDALAGVDNVFYLKNIDGGRSLVLEGDSNVLAKNRLGLTGELELKDVDVNKMEGSEAARPAHTTGYQGFPGVPEDTRAQRRESTFD